MAGLRFLLALLASVTPLSPDQQARLDTAADGRGHEEEAFTALVENVSAWTGGPGDEAVRLRPDIDRLLENPGIHRGDLCVVEGVLEQETILARPFEGVREWFVRDGGGRPLIAYVVDDGRGARRGDTVRLLARFYKQVNFVARDGVERAYAAFVAAAPERVVGTDGPRLLLAVGVPVVVLLVLFTVLLITTRRRHRRPSRRVLPGDEGEAVDDGVALPDDPVEALDELRHRADRMDS